jgi:hypothetical protein
MTGTATGAAKFASQRRHWQTAAAAKTIRIIHDTYEGRTTLYFEQLTGHAVANTDIFFPSTSDGIIGPTITITGARPPRASRGIRTAARSSRRPQARSAAPARSPRATSCKGATSGAIIQAVAP